MPNTEILPIFLLLQITATDDVHYISCFSVKLNDKVKKVQWHFRGSIEMLCETL